MKKFLSLILAAMLLTLGVMPALAATPVYRYVHVDNGTTVNLRETPDLNNGKVLTVVKQGEKVTLLDGKTGGTWTHVVYNGYYGYIMTRYLTKTKPEEKKDPVVQVIDFSSFKKVRAYKVYVHPTRAGGFVNLRWAPSKSNQVIEKLYEGAELTVICEGKNWLQVMDNQTGYVGFVMTEFVKK